MRVSGKGKGSKQEWGVSNAVVAAIYSAGSNKKPSKEASACSNIPYAFSDDE